MSEKAGIKCWCVVGDQGEYSDWTMWLVGAFDSKTEAEEWAAAAEKWRSDKADEIESASYAEREKMSNPYDPAWEVDSWDTPRYSVHELDPLQVPSPSGDRR